MRRSSSHHCDSGSSSDRSQEGQRSSSDLRKPISKKRTCRREGCGESFTQQKDFYRHLTSAHRTSSIQTHEKCRRKSRSKRADGSGSSQRDGNTQHICEICQTSFTKRGCLNKHIRTVHEKQVTFTCERCGMSFNRLDILNRHVRDVHERPETYKCPSCDLSFPRKDVRDNHFEQVHEKKKKYRCERCGDCFSQCGSLNKHIATVHEGHRNHVCNPCNLSFTRRDTLLRHNRRFHQS